MKLDKEFKDKWVEALRSGEYKQGNSALLCSGKYCCLGVAAHVIGVPETILKSHAMMNDSFMRRLREKGFSEMADRIPEVLIGDYTGCKYDPDNLGANPIDAAVLAHLNDKNHFTFEQLADVIDKYL